MEIPHDPIRRWRGGLLMFSSESMAPTSLGFDTLFPPQSCDSVLAALNAATIECVPGLHTAIGFTMLNMNAPDLDEQLSIRLNAGTDRAIQPIVKTATGYVEQLA